MKAIKVKCGDCLAQPDATCVSIGYGDREKSPMGFHPQRLYDAKLATAAEAREKRKAAKAATP